MKDSRDFTRRKRKFLYPYCIGEYKERNTRFASVRIESNRREKSRKGNNNRIVSCSCSIASFVLDFSGCVQIFIARSFDPCIFAREIFEEIGIERSRERCIENNDFTIIDYGVSSEIFIRIGKRISWLLKRKRTEIRARGKRGSFVVE